MSELAATSTYKDRVVPGGVIAGGKYQLLHELGEGGMGSVWRAIQMGASGFAKPVALKMMSAHINADEARNLFLNEARISAKLHHPNVIEIYDLGRDGPIDYIAMEYLEGVDLQGILRGVAARGGKGIPWELAAFIVMEACKGLHYAHQLKGDDNEPLGLIHRDLKPGNVLVSHSGFVKVIDFGIAKSALNDGKTKTGLVKGTPAYMAPEQLASKPLDPRSDLFSLGAVLYELCTGHPPFGGETIFNVLYAIQGQPPRAFNDEETPLPATLKQVILSCLEKEPARRFPSARALRVALRETLEVQGVKVEHEALAVFMEDFQGAVPEALLPTGERPLLQSTPAAFDTTGIGGTLATGEATSPLDSAAVPMNQLPTEQFDPAVHGLPVQGKKNTLLLVIAGVCVFGLVLGLWLLRSPTARLDQKGTVITTSGTRSAPLAPRRAAPQKQAARPKVPARTRPMRISTTPTRTSPTPARGRSIRMARALTRPRPTTVQRAHKAPVRPLRRVVPKRFVPQAKAFIALDITPRCQLFAGARRLGVANGARIALAPGRHKLRCINYSQRFIRTFEIRLRPGQFREIKRRFRRGTLFVLSFPSSLLFLESNGQRFGLIGRSHEKIALYEGDYQVMLHRRGKPSHKKRLQLKVRPHQLSRPKVIW